MTAPDEADADRIAYGDDPSQYGELSLPQGTPHGVVVVIHGGFWKAEYDASLGQPLATSLVARVGWRGTSSTDAWATGVAIRGRSTTWPPASTSWSTSAWT